LLTLPESGGKPPHSTTADSSGRKVAAVEPAIAESGYWLANSANRTSLPSTGHYYIN
jgi:hypothetical protein